ncbi:MAG: helix-turn-helix domain-containing protein [Pseudomonadota bacterium]
MPRSTNAKHKFIETAALLFQERGFNGVGLTEIIEKSDAPKGSFYHHFPGGKDELAKESVKSASIFMAQRMSGAFEDAQTFNEGVVNLFERVADWFEQSDWKRECPQPTPKMLSEHILR